MVDTDFMNDMHRLDRSVLPALRELGLDGRVYFGSDFPNIPYPYEHQLDVIRRWDLGDDWMRAVLWDNAARLFGAG
jgi:predicted TIM-barrel fold metal-dependent hydrolase